jgi:TolB-like protein
MGPASSGQRSAVTEPIASATAAPKPAYGKIALAMAAIAAVVLGVFFWPPRRQAAPASGSGGPKTLAVLPLQNLGADKDLDFLRLALADEIATSLSYVPSLSIRPFATTSKYDSPTLDLQEAGHAMHVTDVVTGHYLKEGSQLQITLEAIDVENNRTLWRDTMTVAAPDMIAMRGQITAKVRQGLVPPWAREPILQKEPRIRKTKRPTIYTCAASRYRMILVPTKTPSPCWSARLGWTPTTPRPGARWPFAIITMAPTRTEAAPRFSVPTAHSNGRWVSIRTSSARRAN